MQLPPLNLPPYPFKLRQKEGKLYVFDELRKKHLLCTPEEWVRQHVVQFLITKKGYPKSLIQLEGGLSINTLAKRHDILAFDTAGKKLLLVECKAPQIKISQAVVDQASLYNHIHKAPLIMVSNGLQHVYCSIDFENSAYHFLEEIPDFIK